MKTSSKSAFTLVELLIVVKAGAVKNSSGTILATELWGSQAIETAKSNVTSYNPYTTLDFVGRNHGSRSLGPVANSTQGPIWDLRQSNFLYLDGHVETKHVSETVGPINQWGDKFYSLPLY